MQQITHVIWDWNGTLLDDAWLCVDAMNHLLAKRGLPLIDEDRYQREFTFPVEAYYRTIGFEFVRETFQSVAHEFLAQYDRRRVECDLQPGVRGVISALAARGYTQSVLSAMEQSRLEAAISHVGLLEQFVDLIGIGDCYAGGKIGQGREYIARLEFNPSEIMMIGDTLHDYEVAEALGIGCILIPSGHCSRERIVSCGAMVLDTVDALIDLCTPLITACVKCQFGYNIDV
jgi:phosphoglycolate phosphatase